MNVWIGIDPGKTGAVALITDGGECQVLDMPYIGNEVDVRALKEWLFPWAEVCAAVAIEHQWPRPGQGVSSVFALAEGYGMLKGLIYGMGFRVELVRPNAWKKAMGIPAGADKDASRELAARLFPGVELIRKKDHGRAEALLLAEFARRR